MRRRGIYLQVNSFIVTRVIKVIFREVKCKQFGHITRIYIFIILFLF